MYLIPKLLRLARHHWIVTGVVGLAAVGLGIPQLRPRFDVVFEESVDSEDDGIRRIEIRCVRQKRLDGVRVTVDFAGVGEVEAFTEGPTAVQARPLPRDGGRRVVFGSKDRALALTPGQSITVKIRHAPDEPIADLFVDIAADDLWVSMAQANQARLLVALLMLVFALVLSRDVLLWLFVTYQDRMARRRLPELRAHYQRVRSDPQLREQTHHAMRPRVAARLRLFVLREADAATAYQVIELVIERACAAMQPLDAIIEECVHEVLNRAAGTRGDDEPT